MKSLLDIPTTLDKIVTKNTDRCVLSQVQDIFSLPAIFSPPCPAPVKNIIHNAKILKVDVITGVTYHVVGTSEWDPPVNVTSFIVGINKIPDTNRYLVKTKNSYYYVDFVEEDINEHDVLDICAAFNYWGMSDILGSPKIFY